MTRSILIIDDEPLMRLSMLDALKAEGYQVQEASNGEEGIQKIKTNRYDLVITDLRMPGSDGLQVVRVCKEYSPETEVIVITAHGSVDTAVQAMKLGAHDYVTKPFSMDELLLTVDRATQVQALRQENTALRQELEGKFNFEGIVGKNEQMRQVLEKVKLVATTDATVLIVGESGTGKEVIANAIHRNSPRYGQALIKVSCAALPETLLETELFGHEKGAFTGALKQRLGRFELAHKGTLFLDEIGEISPMVQVKLLRVLQERRFERVGGTETIESDVRLVCATQKNLKEEVEAGRFREDLFYRLNVVQVVLPPMRERKEDILILANHLLQRSASRIPHAMKGFSASARDVLLRYSFPGNVRELENTVERAVALAQERDEIQVWDLCGQTNCPFLLEFNKLNHLIHRVLAESRGPLAEVRERCEREYILAVLAREGWSRTATSKPLDLSRKALWEKCRRYGIATQDPIDGEEPTILSPSPGEPLQSGCGFCQEELSNILATSTLAKVRERCERDYILAVLEREGWSPTAASKSLGLSRKTLWEKCRRYGISTQDATDGEESTTVPPLQAWVSGGIKTETWPFQSDLVSSVDLAECVPQYLQGATPNAISRVLIKEGARVVKVIVLGTGKSVRLLSVRRHDVWQSVEKKVLREYYEKAWLELKSDQKGRKKRGGENV